LKAEFSIFKTMKKLISDIIENRGLTISASISLGIHLLLIFTATLLFSGAEVRRTPIRNVKVTLYPLEEEKKSIPKFAPPLSVKNQIQKLEKREVSQEEKQRKPVLKKEFEPAIPLPIQVQVTVRDIPFEEQKLIFPPREEEKIAKEPTKVAMDIASDKASYLKKEENLSVPSLPGTVKGNNLSGATSGEGVGIGQGDFSRGGPGNGLGAGREGFLWKVSREGIGLEQGGSSGGRPGNGSGSGTGSGESDFRRGGSRKGAGILGKLFSSSGEAGGGYARYAENPKPSYPEEAREKGMEGEVLLRVEVLANGRVGQIEVRRSSGHEILDQSALSTVKQWKFIPARRGNELIPCWVNIPIKFQLR
jgi:TonB family protein